MENLEWLEFPNNAPEPIKLDNYAFIKEPQIIKEYLLRIIVPSNGIPRVEYRVGWFMKEDPLPARWVIPDIKSSGYLVTHYTEFAKPIND